MIQVVTNIGLGDNFASRPTVAALLRKHGEIALTTPYPQVFSDMRGILFMRPSNLNIRCAKRNADAYPWTEGAVTLNGKVQLGYSLFKGCKDIPTQIAESAGVTPEWNDFFMPNQHDGEMNCDAGHRWPVSPLGVFRIPTLRTEFKNSARNPFPGLVAAAVDEIGGDWISLNDLDDRLGGHERLDECEDILEPKTRCAEANHGELSIPTCLDLVSRARCVVTPISWMAWAALAYGVPTLLIMGGYCDADTIFGEYLMHNRADDYRVATPNPFCNCFNPSHACDKTIPIEHIREVAGDLK